MKVEGLNYWIQFGHITNQSTGVRDDGYDVKKRSTICTIIDDESRLNVVKGFSHCHANDNYCKETGRKIALSRAVETLPKNERAMIWQTYLNRKNK